MIAFKSLLKALKEGFERFDKYREKHPVKHGLELSAASTAFAAGTHKFDKDQWKRKKRREKLRKQKPKHYEDAKNEQLKRNNP